LDFGHASIAAPDLNFASFAYFDREVATEPVKVFILAGQSNMEGARSIEADPKRNGGRGSLEFVVNDAVTVPCFKHLVDQDGK